MILLIVALAAIAFSLLTYLWGRLEESFGWKGPVCGCAILLVLAMAALEARFPTWGLSPMNLVDPSDGEKDHALEAALTRALLDQPPGLPMSSPSNPRDDIPDVRLGDFPELEARLRSVPGWDLIVLLRPLETGERAAQDPRITSWWLRRRIAALWNPCSEFNDVIYSEMFVVRDDAIVGEITVQLMVWPTSDWTSLIARIP